MIKHILLIAASVIMIYPLLWLIASSLRPSDVIFRSPGLWLNDLYVENYTQGWYALSYPFGQYIINSAIVVLGAIAGNLLACTLAAYAFARLRFRLRGLWFAIMLLTLMLPFTFIWTWSDFFTPLIYLTDPIAYTVPVALRSFLDATAGSNWGAMFAMSVVTLIPLFLVFLFGQRFLVKGIATTGGK